VNSLHPRPPCARLPMADCDASDTSSLPSLLQLEGEPAHETSARDEAAQGADQGPLRPRSPVGASPPGADVIDDDDGDMPDLMDSLRAESEDEAAGSAPRRVRTRSASAAEARAAAEALAAEYGGDDASVAGDMVVSSLPSLMSMVNSSDEDEVPPHWAMPTGNPGATTRAPARGQAAGDGAAGGGRGGGTGTAGGSDHNSDDDMPSLVDESDSEDDLPPRVPPRPPSGPCAWGRPLRARPGRRAPCTMTWAATASRTR